MSGFFYCPGWGVYSENRESTVMKGEKKVFIELKKSGFRYPVNLQYFAEGGEDTPNGATDPAPVNPLIGNEFVSDDQPQSQGLDQGIPQEPENSPSVEELDFGGRKIPVLDPALKDLHGDWRELNRAYQTVNQQLQQAQQQLNQYQQFLSLMQNGQIQPQQQQPQQIEMTPEQREQMKEQFMEKFYEDPFGAFEEALKPLLDKYVKPELEPIRQSIEPIARERQFNEQFNALVQKYPDANDQNVVNKMIEIYNQFPQVENMQNAIETLYLMAKGQIATQQPTTLEQLANDPNFVQQMLNDKQIYNQFVNKYLAEVNNKQQLLPNATITTSNGGQTPQMPQEKPTNIQEASRMARRFLGL